MKEEFIAMVDKNAAGHEFYLTDLNYSIFGLESFAAARGTKREIIEAIERMISRNNLSMTKFHIKKAVV